MQKKYCPECRLYLEIDKFKKLTTQKSLDRYPDGYYWSCSDCYKKKVWIVAPDAPRNRQNRRRDKRLRRVISVEATYGLSEEEYMILIHGQSNLCAICRKKVETKMLCVDHDHATGKVRGLLCGNCNIGLGNFKDNPKLLEAAIAYLLEKGCSLKGKEAVKNNLPEKA